MAGLVSSATQPLAAPKTAPMPGAASAAPSQIPQGVENPGSNLKNSTLNQIESGVEAKIPQQYQKMYQSIVVAAMDLCFNDKTHGQMIKGLQSSPDVYKNVSLVVAGMLGIIYEQTKPDANTFLPAAMPAAIVIMCQILDFAEQAGMLKITDDQVAKCTNDTSQAVLRKFGVDGAKVKQAVDAKQGADGAQPPTAPPQAGTAPPSAPQPPQGA